MNATAPREPDPSLRLWFGILGAPMGFAILGLLGWLLSAGACPQPGASSSAAQPITASPRGLLMVISLVALLICLAALAIALSEWRRSRNTRLTAIRGESRTEFLAAVALLTSTVFTVSVALMSMPIYILSACEVIR